MCVCTNSTKNMWVMSCIRPGGWRDDQLVSDCCVRMWTWVWILKHPQRKLGMVVSFYNPSAGRKWAETQGPVSLSELMNARFNERACLKTREQLRKTPKVGLCLHMHMHTYMCSHIPMYTHCDDVSVLHRLWCLTVLFGRVRRSGLAGGSMLPSRSIEVSKPQTSPSSLSLLPAHTLRCELSVRTGGKRELGLEYKTIK